MRNKSRFLATLVLRIQLPNNRKLKTGVCLMPRPSFGVFRRNILTLCDYLQFHYGIEVCILIRVTRQNSTM